MIAVLTTTDPVKISAVSALLKSGGIACEVFDAQVGGVLAAVIPLRIMVADDDAAGARRLLREAGFLEAKDGDWDLELPSSDEAP